MFQLSDYISEFSSSERFRFLDPTFAPHAETLLAHWCASTTKDVTIITLEDSLQLLARLDLPPTVRQGIPTLLKEFFSYLATSGHYPPAGEWVALVELAEKKYLSRLRDDGSVKGETFQKKYTAVGRNDPCPCGSGNKFKKCCMGLIS